MSEYSCISLDALSTQVNTLPNEANQWRFLAVSPEGVTYLVNAASMVPVNSVCTNHIVNNAITCDKISAKEIHTKHVSSIDYTCIGGLGTAAICNAGDFLGSTATATNSSCLGGVAAIDYVKKSDLETSSVAKSACADQLTMEYICFGSNCIWIGE